MLVSQHTAQCLDCKSRIELFCDNDDHDEDDNDCCCYGCC